MADDAPAVSGIAGATPWGAIANAAAKVLGTPTSSGIQGATRVGGAITRGDFIVGGTSSKTKQMYVIVGGIAAVLVLVFLLRKR